MIVELGWEFSIGFCWDEGNNSWSTQVFAQPVGVKCAIHKEDFAGNALNDLCRFAQIMGLSPASDKMKTDRRAHQSGSEFWC